MKFAYHDQYQKPKDVLVQKLEAEAVLLNLSTELYYGLDEVGYRMYQLITTASSLDKAYLVLLGEYQVDPDQLRQDFEKLLADLIESDLIVKVDA